MKNFANFISRFLIFTIVIAFCSAPFGFCFANGPKHASKISEENGNGEKVAVIAILGHENISFVSKAASAIQHALQSMEKMNVMDTDELSEDLGSGRIQECNTELDRLKGIYQQGYLQAYSFESLKAVSILNRVLDGLDSTVPSKERWFLWEKVKKVSGVALSGLKKEPAAIRSFLSVLRTRTEMVLSKKNYSPKIISLWSKARGMLLETLKGKLVIESSPDEALVELDGKAMGKTPLIVEVPVGRYHLHLYHPEVGGISSWVVASSITKRIRIQLDFEGAVNLCHGHPGIRLPKNSSMLPSKWWPWLGSRLKTHKVVAVQVKSVSTNSRLSAALVDLERGKVIREGWFEIEKGSQNTLEKDSVDLARFLVTGQVVNRLKVIHTKPDKKARFLGLREDGSTAIEYKPRPWYRTWWTYAIGSGAILLGAVGSHLASDYYSRQSELSTNAKSRAKAVDTSDAWFGIALGGYGLAAAILASGLVLQITFDGNDDGHDNSISLGSGVSSTGTFIMLNGKF